MRSVLRPVGDNGKPIFFGESRGPCWSCQESMTMSVVPVALDCDTLLPVCPKCWKSMTVSERLTLAIQFMDRRRYSEEPEWQLLDKKTHSSPSCRKC